MLLISYLIQQDTIPKETIVKAIEKSKDTIEKATMAVSDHVEIYKHMLDSQSSTYNLIITLFLGILAVFLGATWWYNIKVAKKTITKETDKIFQKEKTNLIKQFKKEFELELEMIKGENSRLFANTIIKDTPTDIVYRFIWRVKSIGHYINCNNGIYITSAVELALMDIKKAIKEKDKCKSIIFDSYDPQIEFFDKYEKIPSTLDNKKKELIRLTNDLLDLPTT